MAKITDWGREGKAGEWMGNGGRKRSEWKGGRRERGGKIWWKWE